MPNAGTGSMKKIELLQQNKTNLSFGEAGVTYASGGNAKVYIVNILALYHLQINIFIIQILSYK